jgi:hypothetical protein
MITSKILEEFGFVKDTNENEIIYYKGNYGLKYELNNWLIIANQSGQVITGMNVIETIKELKLHYKDSTGNELE